MKLLSLNCNGIRSASTKGLESFIEKNNFDILCFQEIKALESDINLKFYQNLNYTSILFPAEKKGYSGTAIFTKLKFQNFETGLSPDLLPEEGRLIKVSFDDFILINSYFPSGSSGEERQNYKFKFLDNINTYFKRYNLSREKIILTGDINIAHREIDIHDPIRNKNSSGFLESERAFLDNFLKSGWTDCFRYINGDIKDAYSWWTYRSGARKKNKGWRIDYFFATDQLLKNIIDCGIYTDMFFSDHAPIYLDLKFSKK